MLATQTARSQSEDFNSLKQSEGLYITDLTLTPLESGDQVELQWLSHPNLTNFIVEIRTDDTDSLIYQEKHYRRSCVLPAYGIYSVYPLTTYRRGVPVTISLEQARATDFAPQNTQRHLDILKKKEEQAARQRLRDIETAAAQKEAQEKRDFFASIRGWFTFILFGIFSLFVVLIVWLVHRYKKRPVTATYHPEKDREFENLG